MTPNNVFSVLTTSLCWSKVRMRMILFSSIFVIVLIVTSTKNCGRNKNIVDEDADDAMIFNYSIGSFLLTIGSKEIFTSGHARTANNPSSSC